MPFGSELEPLERRIGYRFRDRGLLEHALTHRSRVHEDASGGVFDNESMEFLGDSVLGFVIADMLFREFPQHNEGQKSKLKASLVSAASLARLGERLDLGEFLILGRGEEKTGGRRKHAIIADCYEALIAAIYLDGGIEPARGFIEREFASLIEEARQHRRGGGASPTTGSRRCRSGCSRTAAGCRSTAWPRRVGPITASGFVVEVMVDGEAGRAGGGAEQEGSGAGRRESGAGIAGDVGRVDRTRTVAEHADRHMSRPRLGSATQSISMMPQFFSRSAGVERRPAPARVRRAAGAAST